MSAEQLPENPPSVVQSSILQSRARKIARRPLKPEEGEQIEVVLFRLANETYGIETLFVQEVFPLKELTTLPGTPPFVLGIVNLRGVIVSVLDIKKFFDLPQSGLTDLNKVLLLHSQEMEFGLVADALLGIRSIPVSELVPQLPTLTGIRREYLHGVTAEGIVILSGRQLLSDSHIVVGRGMER